MFSQAQKERIAWEAKKDLVRLYAKRKDILKWGKVLFPEKFTLPFCRELHDYFVEIRNDPFTNTRAPRGHAKTTIKCFLIPIFQALEEPETYQHYLNIQNTSTKAINVNISLKSEFEENELLRAVYGDLTSKEKWTEKQFVLSNGIIFSAIGSGESMRGINWKNKRPDYMIADDLYDDDDIYSKTSVLKKERWWWGSVYYARAKKPHVSIHVQGTSISKIDLLHKLESDPTIKSKKFSAIISEEKKLVLWKENTTYDELMIDKQRMGSITFAREMLNEVRDDESSIIKESWIQYFDQIDTNNERIVLRICGVDPSVGQNEENDPTGMAVVFLTSDANNVYRWYVMDVVNKRLSLNERINMMRFLHEKWKIDIFRVEGIAGFKDFVAEVKRLTNLPVSEISSVPNKIANLELNSYKFENKKVFIRRAITELLKIELVEQLVTNEPPHDDIRDAVLLCLRDHAGTDSGILQDQVNDSNDDDADFDDDM